MPAPFPHEYTGTLVWEKDRQGVLTATEQVPILGGPPPQFDGKDDYWSPEELLLSSIQLCLMTTFLALLARSKTPIALASYKSDVRAELDKTKDGIRFTKIQVTASFEADDRKAASDLLLQAKKYCIISNALNVPVELVIT